MHRILLIFLRNDRNWKVGKGLIIFENVSRFQDCFFEWTVIFLLACVEGILRVFANFHLQRKFSIFLRNDHDCKVVDPYNRLPQDWPHGGIQRIGWLATLSRFITKWLKRGHVHNLDWLKKELSNENPAEKSTNTRKLEFWQEPNA
jgi:hypothetical protein